MGEHLGWLKLLFSGHNRAAQCQIQHVDAAAATAVTFTHQLPAESVYQPQPGLWKPKKKHDYTNMAEEDVKTEVRCFILIQP